jgi:hypothetical protein
VGAAGTGSTVFAGGGVLAERFAGSGGTVRWTSYLMAGGRYIGIHVENSDETTVTRYPGLRLACAGAGFHTDHLGSIAVITREPEVGLPLVVERLSVACPGPRSGARGTPGGCAAIPMGRPTRRAPCPARPRAASPATSTWRRWA